MSSFDMLRDKTALITGSNRGIGKQMLELFVANGANVYAVSRKKNKQFENDLKKMSEKYQRKVTPLFFDMTNKIQMKQVIKGLMTSKATIDILVNNAGVAHGGLLSMTSIEKIKEVFDINFFSHILLTQQLIRLMRNRSASIINMASIAGIDSYPGYIAYGSSKAALIYATKTLSKELSSHNIRINAIAPGLTDTDMAHQMESKAMRKMIEDSAFNRLANVSEIANTALFLASDLSSFINGQVIRVDGGM